jgi:hypothetical protein
MNGKNRRDDWKRNAAEPLYINAGKGTGKINGFCTPVKTGMGIGKGEGCARKSRKGIGRG